MVIVGTDSTVETEGVDRESMDLPGRQDDLVWRIVRTTRDAVVVVNTGSPVTMPWADAAGALLQTWFAGQEHANALVDVLLGEAEPGGRLPTTLPLLLEHSPAYGNFPGESSEVPYGEGLLMGYRWYEADQVEQAIRMLDKMEAIPIDYLTTPTTRPNTGPGGRADWPQRTCGRRGRRRLRWCCRGRQTGFDRLHLFDLAVEAVQCGCANANQVCWPQIA